VPPGGVSLTSLCFGARGWNVYICPAGKVLTTTGKLVNDGETLLYTAKTRDCRSCLFRAQCCPNVPLRRIPRNIYEEARDVARALAKTKAFERSRRDRKRVEMLFAHLKRIFRLGRLRLRGPSGAQFEFTLAAKPPQARKVCRPTAAGHQAARPHSLSQPRATILYSELGPFC
jgi:hypothetical protein